MSIFPTIQDDLLMRQTRMERVVPSYGEAFGAEVASAFRDTLIPALYKYSTFDAVAGIPGSEDTVDEITWSRSPYYRKGLNYTPKMTWEYAQVMAKYKDIEDQNADIRSRSDLRWPSLFAAGIIGSVPDPLNYVPFVGIGARSRMMYNVGKITGKAMFLNPNRLTRMIVGAVASGAEAGISVAAIQPLVAATHDLTQQEWDMNMAATNVMFSVALAGGIGGVAGAFSKISPEMQMEVLRHAVRDAALGRPTDVSGAGGLKGSVTMEVPPKQGRVPIALADDALEAAVERGMVQNTAGEVPTKVIKRAFHGAAVGGFERFESKYIGTGEGLPRGGFSFTSKLEVAEAYAGREIDIPAIYERRVNEVVRKYGDIELRKHPNAETVGQLEWASPDIESAADAIRLIDEMINDIKDEAPQVAKELKSIIDDTDVTKLRPMIYDVELDLGENPQVVYTSKESLSEDLMGWNATPERPILAKFTDELGVEMYIVADENKIKVVGKQDAGTQIAVVEQPVRYDTIIPEPATPEVVAASKMTKVEDVPAAEMTKLQQDVDDVRAILGTELTAAETRAIREADIDVELTKRDNEILASALECLFKRGVTSGG